jgi:DNA-binding beta-propeller fold protein YncE
MRRISLAILITLVAMLGSMGVSKSAPNAGPYKVLKTVKADGVGGYDYISADVEARRLYVPRNGPMGELMVFNLDTLESVGTISEIHSGGAAVDPKSHHGFSTTRPITMWDTNTLQVIKKIDVDGRPDGIMFDPFNERIWVFSHEPPYATIIDGKEGTVVGTLDLGGEPEQGISNGKGTVYVNISDKSNIAVVDAKELKVTAHLDVEPKLGHGTGLSLDAKNHILFAYYREPAMAAIVNADSGKVITTLPTGVNVDTVAFNPATMEAISAENGGTMTFIRENSPTNFTVEQTLQTTMGAKTLVLDPKTNHLLTMAAEYEPAPANAQPRPAGRPARGPMVPGSFTVLMIGRK